MLESVFIMELTTEKGLKDLSEYVGKAAILTYILNGSHEIEVEMPLNWKISELPSILKETFIERPKHIHITSLKVNISVMN